MLRHKTKATLTLFILSFRRQVMGMFSYGARMGAKGCRWRSSLRYSVVCCVVCWASKTWYPCTASCCGVMVGGMGGSMLMEADDEEEGGAFQLLYAPVALLLLLLPRVVLRLPDLPPSNSRGVGCC